jgi:hypothetical protein
MVAHRHEQVEEDFSPDDTAISYCSLMEEKDQHTPSPSPSAWYHYA